MFICLQGTSQAVIPSSKSPHSTMPNISTAAVASTEEEVKAAWKNADCVCFDVDSTVCTDEGVDELAAFLSVGKEVAEL